MIKKLILLAIFSAIIYFVDQEMPKHYIFKPNELHKIATDVLSRNLTTREMMRTLAKEVNKKYPGHIATEEDWLFNNAGGAMGSMWILHGSISEYLIIFGTPIGTDGHTGRYFADDYFIILEGEQWAFGAGELEREVYKAGTMHHLERGDAKAYRVPERVWALEYCQGWIPAMLPFGTFETFFSTLDFHTTAKLFKTYAVHILREFSLGKF